MKRFLILFAAAALCLPLAAQQTREEFVARYNTITSRLGSSGVGVETLLDKWEAAFPEDIDPVYCRFLYWYDKSRTTSMTSHEGERFLGSEPALTLADSLGAPVRYFEEDFFDDELFGQAISAIDRAIQMQPHRLDLRLVKINALVGYEKDSPDMALSELKSLIDYNAAVHPVWEYPGVETVDKDFFDATIQEYCYTFFRYACPGGYEAFRSLSEKMLQYSPDNVLFLDNMGSWNFVAKQDHKAAMKYYSRVLKLKPSDNTAIKNCILMARRDGDQKNEKKYLAMLVKHAEAESDRLSAQARLDYYNTRK